MIEIKVSSLAGFKKMLCKNEHQRLGIAVFEPASA
jgi:hypothetical protein